MYTWILTYWGANPAIIASMWYGVQHVTKAPSIKLKEKMISILSIFKWRNKKFYDEGINADIFYLIVFRAFFARFSVFFCFASLFFFFRSLIFFPIFLSSAFSSLPSCKSLNPEVLSSLALDFPSNPWEPLISFDEPSALPSKKC